MPSPPWKKLDHELSSQSSCLRHVASLVSYFNTFQHIPTMSRLVASVSPQLYFLVHCFAQIGAGGDNIMKKNRAHKVRYLLCASVI